MSVKRLAVCGVLILPLPLSCSSGGGSAGDDARIVPEGLTVTALPGGNGVLELIALTLRDGPRGAELYAALENIGDVPACSAAFSVELFDQREQSLAAGLGGVLTQRFYRLTDGSGAIAACVGPGDVAMAAVLDLPPDVAAADVSTIVYRCPYHALDVDPIDGLSVRDVRAVTRGAGTAYTGTVVNELDVKASNPSVTVFPVNRAGRPLGVATSRGADAIAPHGSWTFETDTVDTAAADQRAFPAGGFAR